MIAKKDYTGIRYGRLVPIRFLECTKRGQKWDCMCDCGIVKAIAMNDIICGNTRSCGCLSNESRKTSSLKHGKT